MVSAYRVGRPLASEAKRLNLVREIWVRHHGAERKLYGWRSLYARGKEAQGVDEAGPVQIAA